MLKYNIEVKKEIKTKSPQIGGSFKKFISKKTDISNQ